MKLEEAVRKELKRPASSTSDAMFLNMLKSDYEHKVWNTNRMTKVKEKYGIK